MGSKRKLNLARSSTFQSKSKEPVGWIEQIRKEKYCHQKKAKEKIEKKIKNLEALR